MRFVLAIAAFVVAAVMIVLGIAQRTVFLEPGSTSLSATVEDGPRYAVIDSSALSAFPGRQSLSVNGPDGVFVAYGRTADVAAWIGDDEYVEISHAAGKAKLTTEVKEGQASAGTDDEADDSPDPTATDAPTVETPVPAEPPAEPPVEPGAEAPAEPGAGEATTNPAGSDLWLEEFSAERSLSTAMNLPEGISVIIASDGTAPAPSSVRLSWPRDNATPLAGPLLVGGAVVLLIGLALYLWALLHLRRSRRPRRNVPRGPLLPRLPRAPRPKAIKASEITGNGRSITRSMTAVVPVLLVSGLALTGCSADFWPSPSTTPLATLVAAPDMTAAPEAAADVPPPAVTVPQLERIVRKIAVMTADADATLNADAISTRFTGPALEERLSNYKIRAAIPDYTAPPALPASPLTLTLPQQSATWPRSVMSVIQNEDDPTVAPTAVVMAQESPRAQYQIEYAVQLEAAAEVPDVAPATIGAPIIAPDSKLLVMPPNQIAAAYADILMQGEASSFYDKFDVDGDTFRTQVGLDKKNEKKAALPTTATIEFATTAGTGNTVALATNDSGAIVAVSLSETETVTPVDAGATVSPEGASKALSGVEATAKGILSTYSDQLLFHVPAAGSNEKIVLLGFSQGLISSVELP